MFKSLMLATAVLALPQVVQAGTREMYDCDATHVEATLRRVAPLVVTILNTTNVRSADTTEVRLCRSEVLNAYGRMLEVIYELRRASETDGRYFLQIKGGRGL
jgi:hypothetical protein